jgi:hypothetical protein
LEIGFGREKIGKTFFFEKKNQKTFVYLVPGVAGWDWWIAGLGWWAAKAQPTLRLKPICKSFCFFFQKEVLASFKIGMRSTAD